MQDGNDILIKGKEKIELVNPMEALTSIYFSVEEVKFNRKELTFKIKRPGHLDWLAMHLSLQDAVTKATTLERSLRLDQLKVLASDEGSLTLGWTVDQTIGAMAQSGWLELITDFPPEVINPVNFENFKVQEKVELPATKITPPVSTPTPTPTPGPTPTPDIRVEKLFQLYQVIDGVMKKGVSDIDFNRRALKGQILLNKTTKIKEEELLSRLSLEVVLEKSGQVVLKKTVMLTNSEIFELDKEEGQINLNFDWREHGGLANKLKGPNFVVKIHLVSKAPELALPFDPRLEWLGQKSDE